MKKTHQTEAAAIAELQAYGYYRDNMSPAGRSIYTGGEGGKMYEIKKHSGAFAIRTAIKPDEPAIAETDDQVIDRLTEDAINALALIVQKELKEEDGGVAGIYYSDDEQRQAVRSLIAGHFNLELIYAGKLTPARKEA